MLDKGEIYKYISLHLTDNEDINGFKWIFSEKCVAERNATQMRSSHSVYNSQDQIPLSEEVKQFLQSVLPIYPPFYCNNYL